jgi:hypothetical protein
MDWDKILGYVPDEYTRKARLYPALLVSLPLILLVLALFPEGIPGGKALGSLFVLCGGAMLFAQVGRDLGKRKQPWLYHLWGAKPTTRMLRHRDTGNQQRVLVYHKKLSELLGAAMPTAEEERRDPAHADEVYDACIGSLAERTRDHARFRLLFEENCNYGFRRNLWGMKPLGVVVACGSLVGILSAWLYGGFTRQEWFPPGLILYAVIDVVLLGVWLFWITTDWVKLAAHAYAERLLGTVELLGADSAKAGTDV